MQTITKQELGVTGFSTRQYMNPGEQEVLLALIAPIKPKIMVEIGVNEGLTALAVLQNIPSIEQYVGIDVPPDYEFEIAAQRVERPNEPGKLVKHDPRFQLKIHGETSATMPASADVVFIDGDHGKQGVLADSIWASQIVTHGGLIIWHDYGNPTVEVTQVLNRLDNHHRELHHIEGTWLVFEQR
jgi:predicted O-methyltransferase YrrM